MNFLLQKKSQNLFYVFVISPAKDACGVFFVCKFSCKIWAALLCPQNSGKILEINFRDFEKKEIMKIDQNCYAIVEAAPWIQPAGFALRLGMYSTSDNIWSKTHIFQLRCFKKIPRERQHLGISNWNFPGIVLGRCACYDASETEEAEIVAKGRFDKMKI